MRRAIEQLAFLLSKDKDETKTLGQLSAEFDEPTERIMDALDVIKIVNGKPTTIPPIDWGF